MVQNPLMNNRRLLLKQKQLIRNNLHIWIGLISKEYWQLQVD